MTNEAVNVLVGVYPAETDADTHLNYFSYGTYFLFIREETERPIRIPNWMHVESIGQMKRVLLEVILVLLSVFMLKLVLIEQAEIEWSILVLPAMIIAIAISLRLVHFD